MGKIYDQKDKNLESRFGDKTAPQDIMQDLPLLKLCRGDILSFNNITINQANPLSCSEPEDFFGNTFQGNAREL